jgi:peptidoglycan hydrolase CwlO-like protein
MDLDVIGKRVTDLLAFKDKIEGMISGADDHDVGRISHELDQLTAFKASFEKSLPDLEKAIADVAAVVDDLAKVKTDLAPVLEWVASQQKAAEDLKAAHAEASKALAERDATEAAKIAAASEQPDTAAPTRNEPPPGSEAAAERSESEHTPG